MNQCYNRARHRHEHERNPQPRQLLQLDGADTGDNHRVKCQSRDAAQKVIVLRLVRLLLSLHPLRNQSPHSDGQRGADHEIEAPQKAVDRVRKAFRNRGKCCRQPERNHIREKIHSDYDCHLQRQTVQRFRHRVLGGNIRIVHRDGARHRLVILTADFSLAREIIQIYDTHHAGGDIARRGNGKSEGMPSDKSHLLKSASEVIRLSGPLPVAHGKQQSAGLEQVGHEGVRKPHGNHQTHQTLNHVGAHDNGAALRSREAVRLILRGIRRLSQRHRDKSNRNSVVRKHLQESVQSLIGIALGVEQSGLHTDQLHC